MREQRPVKRGARAEIKSGYRGDYDEERDVGLSENDVGPGFLEIDGVGAECGHGSMFMFTAPANAIAIESRARRRLLRPRAGELAGSSIG